MALCQVLVEVVVLTEQRELFAQPAFRLGLVGAANLGRRGHVAHFSLPAVPFKPILYTNVLVKWVRSGKMSFCSGSLLKGWPIFLGPVLWIIPKVFSIIKKKHRNIFRCKWLNFQVVANPYRLAPFSVKKLNENKMQKRWLMRQKMPKRIGGIFEFHCGKSFSHTTAGTPSSLPNYGL